MLSKLNFPWALLMGAALVFSFSACDKDDDDVIINEGQTIMEVLAKDSNYTTLVSVLQRTDLESVLSEKTNDFTLFAPTNAAFAAMSTDIGTITDEQLKEILLYHVFTDDITSDRILDGKTYLNTAATTGPDSTQLTLLLERGGSTIGLNNIATVTEADITTENGVIHEINAVLMPLDVVGHVSANGDFSQLVTALGTASGDLVNTLKSTTETYTVFAPTNTAFNAISSTVSGLTPDQLASVLTYHVVAGSNMTASTLTDNQTLTTVQGENFTINAINSNSITITDAQGGVANVLFLNVQGTNGVVHIIDKVIMPNTL